MGTMEVKLTDYAINGSIVIIDNWELQYNNYTHRNFQQGHREFNSPVMLYLNKEEGKPEFEMHHDYFNKIWEEGTSRTLELDKIDMAKIVPKKFFIGNKRG